MYEPWRFSPYWEKNGECSAVVPSCWQLLERRDKHLRLYDRELCLRKHMEAERKREHRAARQRRRYAEPKRLNGT
jgi:hypothetical protein